MRIGDDATSEYTFEIFTTADAESIESDPVFEPLWGLLVNVFQVPIDNIFCALENPPEEVSKFLVIKGHDEPEDWSQFGSDDFPDDESVISIASHN
jgi:hypothetical protein